MEPKALVRFSLAAGVLAALGAAGCSLVGDESTGSSPDKVVAGGDVSELMKSTLLLQGGCTAAKVGPKQLLVAARCVSGNQAYAAGKEVSFTTAASAKSVAATPAEAGAPADADSTKDAAPTDSGAKDASASATDSGTPTSANARSVTIAEVKIHPSYVAKCTGDLCGFNKLAASDSPDIAVIILTDDLETVPTIPVDLDPVGQADELLAITSGCNTFDGKPTVAAKAVRTEAVPGKSVNHKGSPYETSPQLVTRLASSYVITPAAGWKAGEPRLCKADIGAPLFRANAAAVAGVTSNYTTYAATRGVPVTTHHTRVDAMSRFKIGDWLTTLGAETTHSCSESAGGCVKHAYDGGAPSGPTTDGTTEPGDAGPASDAGPVGDASAADAVAPTEPAPTPGETAPHQDQLPNEEPETTTNTGGDVDVDAGSGKKKKDPAGGCSAAPGTTAPSNGLVIGLALALGAVVARRRRA